MMRFSPGGSPHRDPRMQMVLDCLMIGALAAPVLTGSIYAIKQMFGGSKDAKEKEHQEKMLKEVLQRLDGHYPKEHDHEKKHRWGDHKQGWER